MSNPSATPGLAPGPVFEPREIAPPDVALVAALQADCFAGAGDGTAWNAQAVGAVLAMPGCAGLLLAERDGPDGAGPQPLGFVVWRIVRDECEILSLGVARARRRRGAARALLAETLKRARAAGATRVFLEVAEDNAAARGLYAGAGFRPLARRPDYYRSPDGAAVAALVLGRRLAAQETPAGAD